VSRSQVRRASGRGLVMAEVKMHKKRKRKVKAVIMSRNKQRERRER
jgi:hypothetical protein